MDLGQQEDPCFLYGERVVSRKVRRLARPQSAVERATFRRGGRDSSQDGGESGAEDSLGVHNGRGGLPPRPQSSPAKGRTWAWSISDYAEDEGSGGSDFDSDRPLSRGGNSSPGVSRPSTAGGGGGGGGGGAGGRGFPGRGGRTTPRQAWEDDTDDVTKRILKAQRQQQQQQQQQQQSSRRRSGRYLDDIGRMRSQTSSGTVPRGFLRQFRGASDPASSPFPPSPSASPSPRTAPANPVIEDRKPVSPREKHAKSALDKRAGLAEITSQARGTMSASAWRSHLASTQTAPRSAESQRQVIMDARRNAEKQRQQHVMQKMETFLGQLSTNRH